MSSSVSGPLCSGGSVDEGEGELAGVRTSSSGSSALPRDQSSSVVSLGTPSLPPAAGQLSLTERLISES